MSTAVLELKYTDNNDQVEPVRGSWVEIEIRTHANVPELEAEIRTAMEILNLPDDWDGEGSPGYSASTLERAIKFVRVNLERLMEAHNGSLPVPRINPGPMGSIDVHWTEPTWELLVNIPAQENQPAAFYGDDYAAGVIRGSIDVETPNFGLLQWLMK